jgi:SsrA-binding protein
MKKISIRNKKAFFNYEILESEVAGIVLVGSEVKSVKNSQISFNDSYCDFIGNELFLKNFHIAPYKDAFENHEPLRERKLLLTKSQLRKFHKKYDEKGLTIVPMNLFTDEKGLIKMEIGLARGKKTYDKKTSIKERDIDRESKKEF